ncbi:MAG: glycosyltransferase family 4 protein [Nitrospiraceae bacterium]|nr:glycosyltransferase family 4 protein [Nitrospiraceae bacterium]
MSGDDLAARELTSIESLAAADLLRFVGPTKQMPALFCAADVTVLPTWYDPSSKVILESLMMGTPALSTAYNGASDHLNAHAPAEPGFSKGTSGAARTNHTRGLVVQDPGNADELAAAMLQLCDPNFRAACSAACLGLAEQLSMTRHVAALETVLTESAQRGRTSQN